MYKISKIFVVLLFLLNYHNVFSQNVNLIRDAEIENLIFEISKPIIKNANLDKKNLNFFLDKKKYINAFVTFGNNIFITTELLLKVTNVDQIAGVIAHEIGHIKGGHLNKRLRASENSSFSTIISSILAIGAGIAGSSDAAGAILMGGQHINRQNQLSFSRKQESYADQAAIRYLKKSNYSIKGMYEMFSILEKKEKFSKINPYSITHPLSSERKKIIALHLDTNEIKKNDKLNIKLRLVQAKLIGFLYDDSLVNEYYSKGNKTMESCYAKSIMNYRNGKIKESIIYIDKCLKLDSKNPYFHELKGQILYENNKINSSVISFQNALNINKNEKYFLLALAKSYYASGKDNNYLKSINLLKKYIKKDSFPVEALHFLGLCYGKLGEFPLSSIALAKKFILLNDTKNAKLQINKVKSYNEKNPKILTMVDDLINEINKIENQ